jgi:hypothetical protein
MAAHVRQIGGMVCVESDPDQKEDFTHVLDTFVRIAFYSTSNITSPPFVATPERRIVKPGAMDG